VDPEQAYDWWAADYDSQPDNLMLALDEQVFGSLLQEMSLAGKQVIDVGCGTGRHWNHLLSGHPASITGYDVSEGMLKKLQEKFPGQHTVKLNDHRLEATASASADLLISTLTVAHISNIKETLQEWDRVVKPGGHIIITDYHPNALARGGRRTFKHNTETVAITNNVHPVPDVIAMAGQLGWQLLRLEERNIDDTVKHFYEKQQALSLFEAFKGTPIIYGLLLVKNNAAQ
jgi:ubiquinone/menaquinone biosynthesis C-methylase UbiE